MLLTPRILRGLLGMLIIVKNSVNNTPLVRLGCGIFTSKTSSIAPPSITVTICQVPFTQRLPLNNCWHPLEADFGNLLRQLHIKVQKCYRFRFSCPSRQVDFNLPGESRMCATQSKVIWWTIERVFGSMNHCAGIMWPDRHCSVSIPKRDTSMPA